MQTKVFRWLWILALFTCSLHSNEVETFVKKSRGKNKPPASYQYQLSICAIFQNEASYLKEWIEFHSLVGVQHFYLYNNKSTDHYQTVLQPYINAGIVELIDWSFVPDQKMNWNKIQIEAYMHCIKKVVGRTKWLAVLDVDEYLFPVQEDHLVNFLAKYEECAGVTANWIMFGTSWVAKVPSDALMIEMLHLRENGAGNPHVKSIVRPEYIRGCREPHSFVYKEGFTQVTPEKVPFTGPFNPSINVDKIRINHYWTRDEYYLTEFKIPRRKSWGDSSPTNKDLMIHLNGTSDSAIFKFIPALRQRMHFQ